MTSKVYMVESGGGDCQDRKKALRLLLDKAAPEAAYKNDEIVPVKLSIGDSACVYNLDPELVSYIVSWIQGFGAKPFLFDTNVIYKGSRQNAVDHLTLAGAKGFGYPKAGAPFIIADGLLGQDGNEYEINAGHIKKVRVPSFVGMLDSLVVLSHATGHIFTGFAGTIKNVAMGMSCRPTKQVQHSSMKPSIIEEKCTACGCCMNICPVGAISLPEKMKAHIEPGICIGCGECLCACKFDAVGVNWEEDMDIFCARMDEVANFILSKFKNKFFVTFGYDITQECDCISTKDDRIISRNVGLLASTDPLALDHATVELMSDEHNFLKEHSAYKNMFAYAEKIGLGSLKYELVTL